MTPANYNLVIYEGADFKRRFTFKYDEDSAVDISSMSLRMQIREKVASESYIDVTPFISITDGVNGEFTIVIPEASTIDWGFENGVYDVELVNGTAVDKLLRGTVSYIKEVTR